MRKLFLAAGLSLFLIPLNAQYFQGGAYGGLTTSQIDGDGIGGFDLWGFHGGAFTAIPLGDNSKLRMELAFIQKGSQLRPDSTNGYTQYKARANYIEIPILYQLMWNDLSFELGPALDINVYSYEESNHVEFEDEDEFLRFSLTGIFGINYHFSQNWHLNFRTNISITPARKGSGARGVPGVPVLGGAGQRHVLLSTALVYSFGD